MLACGVAFVFKIIWRGANERKEERGQGGSLRQGEGGKSEMGGGWELLMGFWFVYVWGWREVDRKKTRLCVWEREKSSAGEEEGSWQNKQREAEQLDLTVSFSTPPIQEEGSTERQQTRESKERDWPSLTQWTLLEEERNARQQSHPSSHQTN